MTVQRPDSGPAKDITMEKPNKTTTLHIDLSNIFALNAELIRKRAPKHTDVVVKYNDKEYEFYLIEFLKKLDILPED